MKIKTLILLQEIYLMLKKKPFKEEHFFDVFSLFILMYCLDLLITSYRKLSTERSEKSGWSDELIKGAPLS